MQRHGKIPLPFFLGFCWAWSRGPCLQSCALPLGRKSATPDHAHFYWPPKSDSRQLRLAIKDIIDLKGDIATAGFAICGEEFATG